MQPKKGAGKEDVGIIPLGVPMLTGPGAISAVMVLMSGMPKLVVLHPGVRLETAQAWFSASPRLAASTVPCHIGSAPQSISGAVGPRKSKEPSTRDTRATTRSTIPVSSAGARDGSLPSRLHRGFSVTPGFSAS